LVVLLARTCRWCQRTFTICRCCDRGHAYCSDVCARAGRRASCRAANRRHRQSEEGRLDQRDRQRAFRARNKVRRQAGVTDHSSPPTLAEHTLRPPGETARRCAPDCSAGEEHDEPDNITPERDDGGGAVADDSAVDTDTGARTERSKHPTRPTCRICGAQSDFVVPQHWQGLDRWQPQGRSAELR